MERSPPEEAPESRASLSGFRIPGDWFSFSVFRIAGKLGFYRGKIPLRTKTGKSVKKKVKNETSLLWPRPEE